MTREEEIRQEALKAEKDVSHRCEGDKENIFHGFNSSYGLGFVDGAMWADENPKSPWISVEDDLPCSHEELITLDEKRTKYVIAKIHCYTILSRMYKLDGKWHWENDEPDYWFPIPKLPKEYFKIQRKSL